MRIFPFLTTAVIALTLMCYSCKKSGDAAPGGGNNGNYNYGPGAIYIKQGTDGIVRLNMSTGVLSGVMANWPDAGWDISWDGTMGVKQVTPSAYATITKYIMFNTGNGSTIKEINYEANNEADGGLPYISPDGTKLALRPTFDEGLVILSTNGNVLKHISGYGTDHTFEYLDPISWAADGSIMFKKGSSLYRTTTDFSRASKVKDIPFSDWKGEATASPDGKKIALSLGNHIWLMNTDGSDFHVVTESIQQEVSPTFSPDSKWIAIAANSRAGAPDGFTTAKHLCIIPADGQLYKVYPGEDNRVIQVTIKGQPVDTRGLGTVIVGDFVWRQ